MAKAETRQSTAKGVETIFKGGDGSIRIVVNPRTFELSARPSGARIPQDTTRMKWTLFVVTNPKDPPELERLEQVDPRRGSLLIVFPDGQPLESPEVRWPPVDANGNVVLTKCAVADVEDEAPYGV